MKTVFIATDFSPASRNAAIYGVNMAAYLGAGIVLFHCSDSPVPAPGESPYDSETEIKSIIETKLLNEVVAIRISEFQSIEIVSATGNPHHQIIEYAKKYNQSLIVCGMNGEGRLLKKIIGNTAVYLAGMSAMPVMIIPERAVYAPIKNIVLANDFDIQTDLHTIDMLQSIGERYMAKVYIVRIMPNRASEVNELSFRSERFVQKLIQLHPEYKFPQSKRIIDGLEDFITTYKIDLLALIPHRHNLLKRLFLMSTTKQMIFHSHIPLMILPETKLKLQ